MARFKRFDVSSNNLSYEEIVSHKVQALKDVLHYWGNVLREALRQESPRSIGTLSSSIKFRVEVKNTRGISSQVRLLVGILDPKSPALKYLKFILYGTERHFVPVRYKSKSTGIFNWAKQHGLIARGKGNKWRWVRGNKKGQIFEGIPQISNKPNDFFTKVYERYDDQVRRDIRRILEE